MDIDVDAVALLSSAHSPGSRILSGSAGANSMGLEQVVLHG